MVVTIVQLVVDRRVHLLGGLHEVLDLQLIFQVRIRRASIDSEVQIRAIVLGNQFGSVVGCPGGFIGAQVAGKAFLAPRTVDRIRDRRECGRTLEQARVLQSTGWAIEDRGLEKLMVSESEPIKFKAKTFDSIDHPIYLISAP